ncbi:COMPASS component SPP1 [Ogataea parapolymorpha DL-1]|uniref:COMPASS component SPP1 n=1 Tax=Ogataea parapolymorpha (strain ATCC 26012 / BCRC 20466 / JCM 22074 / NRRL Y-7560 / DL-1) TaxID=871575 RepID=W1QGA5_OGAPD|nr:COMPASS component SPP1 [Ogataea parapolymorpha DL-1]ESW99355.1 COMPASS component SPP1 [Ogataea parapolymorpha DL-1]
MSKVSLQERYNKFSKAAKYNLNSEELFCVCRRVDDGELMVACDGCDEWFHFSCMKLDPKYKDLVSNFYCIFCDELLHKGSTLWKKKCRLAGCYKPVRIDADSQKASKYCSDEHGVEFMRNELLKRFSGSSKECRLREPEIASVVCGVADLDEFRVLGDSMPVYEGMDVDMPEELAQRVAQLDAELAELRRAEALYTSKEKYLLKLRDKIRLVNEVLAETEPEPAKKGKKPKIDVCGYDATLVLDDEQWRAYEASEECQKTLRLACWADLDATPEQAREAYHAQQRFAGLCMADRKKCVRHLTWYSIQYDTVMLRLNEVLYRVAQLERAKERVAQEWRSQLLER